jgi:protein N-terminal methyltransferase
MFLLSLFPHLQTFDSPMTTPAILESVNQRFVALDVGAGVGRVTAEVLLPLVDDVVTIEPVKHFIEEARRSSSSWRFLNESPSESSSAVRTRPRAGAGSKLGNSSNGKRVWFIQGALNDLDPERPCDAHGAQSLGVLGGAGADAEFGERAPGIRYDV